MSEQIRDVATITFSGPRFDDAGLELDVLPELLAYRKLLIETAKRLWRAESRDRRRLPKGFENSIRLKFYTIENGPVAVHLKRVVRADEIQPFATLDRPDEIDDAAQLIDETIEAISRDESLPERMPKSALALLARFGATFRADETLKIRSARNLRPVEFGHDVRERVLHLVGTAREDRAISRVPSARLDQDTFTLPNVGARKILPKARAEEEARTMDTLHDTADLLQSRPARYFEGYDSSVQPIWETLAELGESIPTEAWDHVPEDLSTNLDRYLYGKPEEKQ